jgi:hypothetical protein
MSNVGIIKITLKLLFMKKNSNFFSQIFDNLFVVYISPWISTILFIFSPTRIAKLEKFETIKTRWLWVGGGGNLTIYN